MIMSCKILLVVCLLIGQSTQHTVPGGFHYNNEVWPQVVTNNHDGDLCDALKESLDVLVGAGALSCETLPEEFPGKY